MDKFYHTKFWILNCLWINISQMQYTIYLFIVWEKASDNCF